MKNLQELKSLITKSIDKVSIPPQILLSHFKVGSSEHYLLHDPYFMPFYFQISKYVKTDNLLEINFDLGLSSGCFMLGNKKVDNFLAFRKKDYFYKRLGVANIHNIFRKKFDLHIGNETNPEFIKKVLSKRWDFVIIADEENCRSYLDIVWNQVANDGMVVVDFLYKNKEIYESFCKANNREPFYIKNKGILCK